MNTGRSLRHDSHVAADFLLSASRLNICRCLRVVRSHYCAAPPERLQNFYIRLNPQYLMPVLTSTARPCARICPELLVAVVDDDSSVRRALTRVIRSCGFQVESFSSGDEFLRSLDDCEPDCVVLDVNMPEINGWEVQSHLSRANADNPVVMISGEHDLGALARAKRNGVQHYLSKPVDADLLLGAIRNAIA